MITSDVTIAAHSPGILRHYNDMAAKFTHVPCTQHSSHTTCIRAPKILVFRCLVGIRIWHLNTLKISSALSIQQYLPISTQLLSTVPPLVKAMAPRSSAIHSLTCRRRVLESHKRQSPSSPFLSLISQCTWLLLLSLLPCLRYPSSHFLKMLHTVQPKFIPRTGLAYTLAEAWVLWKKTVGDPVSR